MVIAAAGEALNQRDRIDIPAVCPDHIIAAEAPAETDGSTGCGSRQIHNGGDETPGIPGPAAAVAGEDCRSRRRWFGCIRWLQKNLLQQSRQ